MLGEEKRLQALELVHTLYDLASDLGMKLRIIDSIRECEEALQGDISEKAWVQTELQLGEIIGYMEKQIFGEESQVIVNDEQIVSKEDIKKKIIEIWSRGKETGDQIVSGYQTSSIHILQNVKNSMMDCADAGANYHLLSVPERFESKCIQLSQKYDQDIEALTSDYLNAICEQYAQAMNRIKGLISTIDRKKSATTVTARDIYQKWDNRQELCKQTLKENSAGTDNGKQLLIKFGSEQVEPLRHIKKKNQRKRRFYNFLPLLLVLLLVVGGMLLSSIPKSDSTAAPETSAEGADVSEQLVSKVIDGVVDKIASKMGDAVSDAFSKALKTVVLPLIVLIAVIYLLWVWHTAKSYRKWMVDELGAYISPQIEQFWQNGLMEKEREAYFRAIDERASSYYENIITDIFGDIFGTQADNDPAEVIRNAGIKWNQIRNMR